ncbi:MAG: RsmB/NOP family class I SAM-dependent RNA methyltransferase [Candidatus Poseidoniaceae archaeon]|nr:RsmB/NOP family class I SAM-dependent RNA methyltransferase [Candidatus Poseidoniaceae archaeon]
MSRNEWQEQDLLAVARDTPLANLAKNLGYDLEKWIPAATTSLPETLRVTLGRHDKEWTESLLRELGGAPLPWAEDNFAWQMPFARGQAPDVRSKHILSLLHESGRITRQEAASMLPVVVLDPKPGQLILDLCAAPGSKATQVAEAVAPNGVVVANEPVSGRVNMLVSNRGRLSTSNMLINQQDGRHIGRIPPPGYDGIVADVPCTGSATSRKNRNVWWKWSPKESRSLFRLQVEITTRGASLLRPGGKLVYSTCSIDPCENEAVVAQLLRQLPYLELIDIDESKLKGLNLRQGLDDWDVLDKESNPLARGEEVPRTTFLQPAHMSPSARLHWAQSFDEEIDEALEKEIESQLTKCRRLVHHDNNTGGFFVAMFRHRPEATPEGIARTFIRRRQPSSDSGWEPLLLDQPHTNRHTIYAAPQEIIDEASSRYGIAQDDVSWWVRGKRLNIAPKMVDERIFNQKCPNKRGNLWPEGTFHPLKLIHAGLPAFTKKRGAWRSRQEAVPALHSLITESKIPVSPEVLERMLSGWAPLLDDYNEEFEPIQIDGPLLLSCELSSGEELISAWAGARLTLMMDEKGRDVLRLKLGMPFQYETEEE